MNIKSIARRIGKGEFHYFLGRFNTVRRAHSRIQSVRDAFGRRHALVPLSCTSLFHTENVRQVVANIRAEAVHIGFQLPPHIIKEIDAFARTEPLHPGNNPDGQEFYYQDVNRGYAADGRAVPLGGIRNPIRCPAIRRVVYDPNLLEVVKGYLGYAPRRVLPILCWTFASDFTDAQRRDLKHHVIDYHYDVGGFNFVHANFYIVDTDRHSGAHMMMRRSHDRKPLRMLLGSAVANETDVRREYGIDNEILIEGPAGTGFIQDTSCYHRATAATRGDRLMLAVRFS